MKKLNRVEAIEIKEESKRLPISECRKIMNRDGLFYTDEELLKIRDFMYLLAAIGIEELDRKQAQTAQAAKIISLPNHQTDDYEESHYLRAG